MTLLGELASTRNPLVAIRLPGALGSGLTHDSDLGYLDALGLVWSMKDASPATVAIPVTGRTTSGGAAVLELAEGSTAVFSDLAR